MNQTSETKSRVIKGRVVSIKMDKSITVMVERLTPHPVYGKYIKRSTKLLAHDEENVCQEGDLVALTASRPISKRKSWRLLEVLESDSQ